MSLDGLLFCSYLFCPQTCFLSRTIRTSVGQRKNLESLSGFEPITSWTPSRSSSTNPDSVSLSFIENKAKYSIAHQISLKHYTETEGFSWQAFWINLFNLSLYIVLSFANDEISIIFICKLLNVNQHWGELNMTSLKKYMTSITSHLSPLRGFNGQSRVVTIKSTTFLRSTKLLIP